MTSTTLPRPRLSAGGPSSLTAVAQRHEPAPPASEVPPVSDQSDGPSVPDEPLKRTGVPVDIVDDTSACGAPKTAGTPSPAPAPEGLFVSFLGVDGIGKTTLSREVGSYLESQGFTVRHVAWRPLLSGEGRQWPGDALQELWVEAFRLLFAGGQRAGEPLRMPRDYRSWSEAGWENSLKDSHVTGVRPVGPLAAALVELAANLVVAAEQIQPALARGEVVLQESFPFKHVIKEVLISRRITTDRSSWSQTARLMRTFFKDIFNAFPLRPHVGVLVHGPVDLAYRWRMAQSGSLGVLEDYGAAGEKVRRPSPAFSGRRRTSSTGPPGTGTGSCTGSTTAVCTPTWLAVSTSC